MPVSASARRFAPWLWLLFAVFCCRVAGQILVAFFHVGFLPPMREWMSGLLPYPYLLTSQIVIIPLMVRINLDFSRGSGTCVTARDAVAHYGLPFGVVYFASMVARYAIRMSLYPSERWFGQTIPIVFHCVLATYVILVAAHHRRALMRGGADTRFNTRRRLDRIRPASAATLGLILVACGLSGCRAVAARTVLPRHPARPPAFRVTHERLTMTTSDGAALVADVFHPKGQEKTPTILVRIPYANTFKNRLGTSVVGRYWSARGYTVVVQGTRGRYRSSGSSYPLRSERQDGIETLAWLRDQPWFDGRLGMWGGSSFGHTQWAVADRIAPESSALLVQICSTNMHDAFYPGGAFSLASALSWALRSVDAHDVWPESSVIQRGVAGFPLVEADDRAARDVEFFNDLATHPSVDDFWRTIDGEDRAARLEAPALLMAGWFDPFLPTQIDDFQRIRHAAGGRAAAETRLIVGPWAHATTVRVPGGPALEGYRRESLAPSLDWFDRYVARRDRPAPSAAPVRLFVMGDNRWRDEQEWPLARTRYESWYLRSDGGANTASGNGQLTATAHAADGAAHDAFIYDPLDPTPTAGGAMFGPRAGIARQNDVERRRDVLVYTAAPLSADIEVTGPVRARLWVTTTAGNTDFTAKLVDVHADGAVYNVSDGIRRASFTPTLAGDALAPTEIAIDLWPTSYVFRAGHRIRLEVSSSNFPRFDRNPNTGNPVAFEVSPVAARQSVFHGAGAESRLILPIIPR